MSDSSIITLSGMLGSGKTTIMKMLAHKLDYQAYSTGYAQREIAKRYGVTTLQLNHIADTDPKIDQEIDSVFKGLISTGHNYVVDSRLAFHFIPASFKVKLNVSIDEAARRIYNDNSRVSETKYDSLDALKQALNERRASEVARWQKVYGVNIDDDSYFDLVIDTTDKTPDQICDLILKKMPEKNTVKDDQ